MPEGPAGAPRLTNIGPLSRSTDEEIKKKWDKCPEGGKREQICKEIKRAAIQILEGQGVLPECKDLIDINSGNCDNIAQIVYSRVEGVEIYEVGFGEHVWIEYGGVNYDAEVPSGVVNPLDLPFFGRFDRMHILDSMEMEAIHRDDLDKSDVPETIHGAIREATDVYKQ